MLNENKENGFDVTIVGGLGHVGLPLGIVFADKGLNVCLCDIDEKKAEIVKNGKMPFIEYNAEPLLKKAIENRKLTVSLDQNSISKAKYVIVAIGTPVDEYLNPKTRQFLEFFDDIKKYLSTDQTIIIRSTIYPKTCEQILNLLGDADWNIAYCPERIIQGYSVKELNDLPQIVAGLSEKAIENASKLFSVISPKIIKTSLGEAELVKLFSNAWRYIQFAVANQFYMIAHNFGVDYDKVRHAMKEGYERAATLPTAGFAAGPCLLKDTMQLSSFNSNNFMLGHAAMMINEGLPNFIVDDLRKRYDLSKTKVGILGMAFKADIDDIRDSLSYKLGKILRFHGTNVYYSDEFAKDPTFVTKEKLIEESDVVIVGVPHSVYGGMDIPDGKEVVDLWGIFKKEK
ncbi:nucleotide sugar dehydrogenase [Candidatus Woesearchaeota archaeon]|nr:nucleotide sugar dehydrogenase [Candidatus Woesearchaeota archaeon]|tara:strand:- start:117 stop:1316 length:1200 start_codon:yes stop_codon:yes gene_type:complete